MFQILHSAVKLVRDLFTFDIAEASAPTTTAASTPIESATPAEVRWDADGHPHFTVQSYRRSLEHALLRKTNHGMKPGEIREAMYSTAGWYMQCLANKKDGEYTLEERNALLAQVTPVVTARLIKLHSDPAKVKVRAAGLFEDLYKEIFTLRKETAKTDDNVSTSSAKPVEAPAPAPLPSEKDVMRAWAKEAFEAGNLPEGTNVVRSGGGKVTLTSGNRTVKFFSPMVSSTGPKVSPADPKPEEMATVEKPVVVEALKSAPETKRCRTCPKDFIPKESWHKYCCECFTPTKQTTKPTTKPVVAPAPVTERELQTNFAKAAQASYEAGKLLEGLKCTEHQGGQVVISGHGRSTTFNSESLRKLQAVQKVIDARLAAEAREHELFAESVRCGWAKEAFEAENLPEGAVAKPAGEGKIMVTCEKKTVTFLSENKVLTAEAEKPVQQKHSNGPRGGGKNKGGKRASAHA